MRMRRNTPIRAQRLRHVDLHARTHSSERTDTTPNDTHPRKGAAHCQFQIAISVQPEAQPLELPAASMKRFAAGVDGELDTVDRRGDGGPENLVQQLVDLALELARQTTVDGGTLIALLQNLQRHAQVMGAMLVVREDDS